MAVNVKGDNKNGRIQVDPPGRSKAAMNEENIHLIIVLGPSIR